MDWREVIEHPSLKNLPFKIETNEWGQIVMTPATLRHSKYQGLIIEWFHRLGQWGRVFPELGIQTSDGVKVADVAWGSEEFLEEIKAISLASRKRRKSSWRSNPLRTPWWKWSAGKGRISKEAPGRFGSAIKMAICTSSTFMES